MSDVPHLNKSGFIGGGEIQNLLSLGKSDRSVPENRNLRRFSQSATSSVEDKV